MDSIVTEAVFREVLHKKLGKHFERANMIFKNFGNNLSLDIFNIFCFVGDLLEKEAPLREQLEKDQFFQHPNIRSAQTSSSEVLLSEKIMQKLERHYEEHLCYQHPDIRGMTTHVITGNPTLNLFKEIYEKNLGLTPSEK